MDAAEEREAFVQGFNMALGYLRGYVAARADANRQHLIQNVEAIKSILRDDLSPTHSGAGAITEAFLVALGDVAQALAEQSAGADGLRQLRVLEGAIMTCGQRINAAAAAKPPVPVPGWDSAQCPRCGLPVFEREEHVILIQAVEKPAVAAFHPACADA